ncbi:Elongation of very long chain fatty acids protein 4, partial [Armadillidium vulgare]
MYIVWVLCSFALRKDWFFTVIDTEDRLSAFLAAMMNSFVHVIMYLYYGLSSFGPYMQKYLWWKKYLTCIQLVQFSAAGVLGLRALIAGCEFPLWMQYALVIYMLSFIILFSRFYKSSYKERDFRG